MIITKCDICKKVIKKGDIEFSLTTRPGLFASATVCLTCGKPVHELFKKYNLGDYKKQIARRKELSAA